MRTRKRPHHETVPVAETLHRAGGQRPAVLELRGVEGKCGPSPTSPRGEGRTHACGFKARCADASASEKNRDSSTGGDSVAPLVAPMPSTWLGLWRVVPAGPGSAGVHRQYQPGADKRAAC